jgi:hypothetical protein
VAGGWGAGNGPAAFAGNGAGFGGGARGQPVQDYRDMLPPVQYAPGAFAPPRSAPERSGAAARGTGRSPAGPLLVLATIAAAVGISIVLPLAGTVAAVIGLTALRALGQTAGRLSRRRSRKGAQASDSLLAVLVFPLSFAWSAIRSLLLAPAALVFAALAMAITIIAVPHHVIPVAFAYGAGALAAFYGLGPGSGATRRPLRKFYDTVAGTPATAAVVLIAVAAVVVTTAVVAASHPPFFWPFSNFGNWLSHFTGLRNLVRDTRTHLLRLVGR